MSQDSHGYIPQTYLNIEQLISNWLTKKNILQF